MRTMEDRYEYDKVQSTWRPIPRHRLRWDVFLSFRGEDTRSGFTAQLFDALVKSGVRVFRDNEGMTQGDQIAPSLLGAIEDSAAAITIISPRYASSGWCLEELSTIQDCRLLILPVFYQVDPSDVRRQTGNFEKDLNTLQGKYEPEQIERWRTAMTHAGGICGWVFPKEDGHEPDPDLRKNERAHLIQCLVKRVLSEISNSATVVAPYSVGLTFPMEKVMRMLEIKSSSIKIVGLFGRGGIGKTTLAKAIYNKATSSFDSLSFISNVREISQRKDGFISLQEMILLDFSSRKVSLPNDVHSRKAKMEGAFHGKRAFIVVDDIDHSSQFTELISMEWLFPGSRILITSRNRQVLQQCCADHDIYDVQELGPVDSLKLVSYHALRREKPKTEFHELCVDIASFAKGLPLALEVFGSFLYDKSTEEWTDAIEELKKIRPEGLQGVLKISIDGLDNETKCMFLDIACLLVGHEIKIDEAIDIFTGCGFSGSITNINTLIARSLVKVDRRDNLVMHDQIRDMGRQIVNEDNPISSTCCTRLWDIPQIMNVFENAMMGMENLEGIVIDFMKKKKKKTKPNVASSLTFFKIFSQTIKEEEGLMLIKAKNLEPMVNLRLFHINHNVKLEGDLPPRVRWFKWSGCPLKQFPLSFFSRELRVLHLPESKINSLCWDNEVAEKLIVLNLYGCDNLASIEGLTKKNTSLKKLILEGCRNLSMVHISIETTELRYLNLRNCISLVELCPCELVSSLRKLEVLILSGCSKFEQLPKDLSAMISLKELLLDGTAIKELPDSIFHLVKLEKLNLSQCKSLEELPVCIGQLSSLKEFYLDGSAVLKIPHSIEGLQNLEKLNLMGCGFLTDIPPSIGMLRSLRNLSLNGTPLEEIPSSIGSLVYLNQLSAGKCKLLKTLPSSITSLGSLQELELNGSRIANLPDEICGLKSLVKLEIMNSEDLTTLPKSIGDVLSLKTLLIGSTALEELPESIGMLENLSTLSLNQCTKLRTLPGSIASMRSLRILQMEDTAVSELPENFGMLTNLIVLEMGKKPYSELAVNATKNAVLPSSFSNLCKLEKFNARSCNLTGGLPDDFERLSRLEILNLGHNYGICTLPSSLEGLGFLKKLLIPHCREIKSLPPLPSSLLEIDASNCTMLAHISDLSKLKYLRNLNIANCGKLENIPGFECLVSLRRLQMVGCKVCWSAVKAKLSKTMMNNLEHLIIPRSEIPSWLGSEVIKFSKKHNNPIKEVIIAVIVRVKSEQQNRELGILARIMRGDLPVFTTTLEFRVPEELDKDHLCIYRYRAFKPLVSMLIDGDKIDVVIKNPPPPQGVELRGCRIKLVFEVESQQSDSSERLVKFLQSSSGSI